MRGIPVSVIRNEVVGKDAYGMDLNEEVRDEVDNVLFAPGTTSDLDAKRPEGVKTSVTFHFPKSYTKSLRGCTIEYDGRAYEVVGDPVRYPVSPTDWNMPVLAVMVNG